jgi:VanZ family protein
MDTTPLPAAPMTDFDKLIHLFMFMGLSGVVFFDNTHYLKKKISLQRIFFGSFLFPVLFSGSIEVMQSYFTTSRTGDWMDFLFDGIGSLCGILICWLINRKLSYAPMRECNY